MQAPGAGVARSDAGSGGNWGGAGLAREVRVDGEASCKGAGGGEARKTGEDAGRIEEGLLAWGMDGGKGGGEGTDWGGGMGGDGGGGELGRGGTMGRCAGGAGGSACWASKRAEEPLLLDETSNDDIPSMVDRPSGPTETMSSARPS